jgi:hypothetical protein
LTTSGSEFRLDPAAVDELLARAKARSAQLRRRRMLFLGWSGAGHGGRAPRPAAGVSRAPRRFTPSVMALGGGSVVVAVAVAIVLVTVTAGGPVRRPSNVTPPLDRGPGVSAVLQMVTGVTPQIADAVAVDGEAVNPPTVQSGQGPLTINGKPGAVFIGGEFCSVCAAERWAIIMAFSRFGSFRGLTEISSSPWDTDPSTATFSFYRSTYTSPVLTLEAVENEGNDTDGPGTRTVLQPLGFVESQLWKTYDPSEGFPFLDIGNKFFVLSPSFDPADLTGLDQIDIARKLSNPDDPVTDDIVMTANYLTAALCSVLGSSSSPTWCQAPAITRAAVILGLR